MERKDALTKIGLLHNGLISYSIAIGRSTGRLNNILAMLYEETKIKMYHKGSKALVMLKVMMDECKNNYQNYLFNEERRIKEIELLNRKLAEKIMAARSKQDTETFVLMQLSRILQQIVSDMNFGINYASTHIGEILDMIGKIKDRKIAEILRKYFITITGHELNSLAKYIDEVRAWSQKIISMPLTYFVLVTKAFLFGDKRLGYLGLLYYFRDEIVAKRLYKKDNVRQLLNFLRERKYLESIRENIKAGINEGKWQRFYEFWNHIESVIKDLEQTYGSVRFGEAIREKKSKFQESPDLWLGLFNQILNEVYNPEFVRKVVIEPAALEIEGVFSERFNELNADKANAVQQTRRLIDMIAKKAKIAALHSLKSVYSEEEDLQNQRIEEMKKSVERPLRRYKDASEALQNEAQGFVAFLRQCGVVAMSIQDKEEKRSKAVEALPRYRFTRFDHQNLVKAIGPVSSALNNALWPAVVNNNTLAEFENYSEGYLGQGMQILAGMAQLYSSVNADLKQVRIQFKDDFETGFWQEAMNEHVPRNEYGEVR